MMTDADLERIKEDRGPLDLTLKIEQLELANKKLKKRAEEAEGETTIVKGIGMNSPEMKAAPGTCGLLRRHMYGTRRAAEGWQNEYSASLVEMGFSQGAASPCVFHHRLQGVMVSVHGDDFTAAGPKSALDWFEAQLKARYELTVGGRLGPGPDDCKEATILNRVVRWTSEGLEHEADPRQVERLLEELDLEGEGVKGLVTPGVKPCATQFASERELPENEHTKFRGIAARANYLAADRPDPLRSAAPPSHPAVR